MLFGFSIKKHMFFDAIRFSMLFENDNFVVGFENMHSHVEKTPVFQCPFGQKIS